MKIINLPSRLHESDIQGEIDIGGEWPQLRFAAYETAVDIGLCPLHGQWCWSNPKECGEEKCPIRESSHVS